MELNLDCVRDVLFLLEDNLTITSNLEICFFGLEEIVPILHQYNPGEIANVLLVLHLVKMGLRMLLHF